MFDKAIEIAKSMGYDTAVKTVGPTRLIISKTRRYHANHEMYELHGQILPDGVITYARNVGDIIKIGYYVQQFYRDRIASLRQYIYKLESSPVVANFDDASIIFNAINVALELISVYEKNILK